MTMSKKALIFGDIFVLGKMVAPRVESDSLNINIIYKGFW